MSGSPQRLWDRDTNSLEGRPQGNLYEKAKLFGNLSSAILYGIVIILFFQCSGALFNPVNRTRGGFRWLLVAHTVAMFLFATIYTAANLNIVFISYIDNRGFPGVNGTPPGPLGYQYTIYNKATGIVSTVMFLLNNWLADGLLLYRCYVIYAMNPWAIAFPCLLYLATFATGTVLVYDQISHPSRSIWRSTPISIGIPYSISVALDIVLTVMIIARLVLLSREIQKAMNAPFRLGGLYKAVIAVISESSALYAVTFLLFVGTWAADNPAEYYFFPVLAQTQVIAPFLIVLRVANRTVLNNNMVSRDIASVPSNQGGSTGGSRTPLHRFSAGSKDIDGMTPEELGGEVVMMVDLAHTRSRGLLKT